MQLYTQIAYISRGLDPVFNEYVPCEYCEYKYYNYKDYTDAPRQRREIRNATDIDHIEGRGWDIKHNYNNRMYEPTNLIFLCRQCHNLKRGNKMIETFKKIVLSKLVIKDYDRIMLRISKD